MATHTAPPRTEERAAPTTSLAVEIRRTMSGNIRQYGMMIALLLLGAAAPALALQPPDASQTPATSQAPAAARHGGGEANLVLPERSPSTRPAERHAPQDERRI